MCPRPLALYAALSAAALLLLACDPPGRPKPVAAQAENREAITDFKTLFEGNCAGCHGVDGRNGPARILNDALYLSVLPHDTLKQIVVYGRPGTSMPAWAKSQGGPLTDAQVDILVNGIYANWSRSSVAPTDAPRYTAASAGNPTHGKQLFLLNCFMCHGKGAPIGTVSTPNYLRLVSNHMIRTSIIVGRPDLGMPSYKNLNRGKALSDSDVTDLVAYLNSLRADPAPGEMPTTEPEGPAGSRTNENGSAPNGPTSKGNEGSGNGPGSPRHQENEGNKNKGNSSQQGVK